MSNSLVPVGVISDADNTLWDTDRLYAESQLWLLTEVESQANHLCTAPDRLAFIRRVDQLIAKNHHHGLKYPSALLVTALRHVLAGTPPKKAASDALYIGLHSEQDALIAQEFDDRLKRIPALRVGVKEALRRLSSMGIPILIATEGSIERCRQRLKHWGLSTSVKHVLSAPKSAEFFTRAAKLLKLPTSQCFVIGDQLDRDILYATSAGCKTVYFPGGFRPAWSPKMEDVRPHYVIDTFAQLVSIISDHAKRTEAKVS